MRKTDTRLIRITVERFSQETGEYTKLQQAYVHAERIDALVDWLNWAEKQTKKGENHR